ncbi:uncharacterized protein LOC110422693 [Herrania umbratica]|uniref:Uncharacterized protein LOC110422693 n=1 Tax=Herrania umbratica TaxID=108875 RepID=A0A6J1AZF8_9ROSI|nr:uncharacterized protein LOC110422693 [Herrania umbratica]
MAMEDNKANKKRTREESEGNESEANSVSNLKLARVYSADTGFDSPESTIVEPDPDDGNVQSPEVKRIQEDLLNILDDSDPVIGPDPAIQGLDSVIKSFEEEILVPTQAPAPAVTSDSGESRPVLGFLLEASDDELGLPPSFSSVEEEQKFGTVALEEGVDSGAVGIGEMMGYEFPIPSFEPYEFGIGGDSDTNNNNYSNSADFVALGGLFEPATDISELTWRPESLSAL